MKYIELGEILDYEQPTKYIVNDTRYNDNYDIPVLTAGQSFILGYTNENENVFEKEKLPVIIFDDFTTSSQFVDFQFKVKSSAMKILKAKPGVNIKYVYYAMQMIKFDSQLHKRYWISQYSNIKIPIPDIKIQNDIVKKLDNIKDILDKKDRQKKILNKLINSKFIEMFGNINSKKWEEKKLVDLTLKITDGKHGGCQKEEGSGYYFVGASEIFDDKINYQNANEITENDFKKDYNRCDLQLDDFVIVNTGATIGKSAIVTDIKCEKTLLQKSVALIRTKKDILLPGYLKYCYANNPSLYSKGQGCARVNLLLSQIKDTTIPVPPIELQKKFLDFINKIDKQKKDIDNSKEKINKTKESLMNKYFN